METDWILVLKMKQGDEEAGERFVRKYYSDILKYCHFHCQNRNFSEDLTQETFLRFFLSLPRYLEIGKAKNYLYIIAGNLCADAAKSPQTISLEQEIPVETMEALDTRILLDHEVRRLPAELREIIVLHYYQGLKLSDVASVLGIGLPLVKYRLRRAKDQLRKELTT